MGFRGGVTATTGAERTPEVVKDRWAATRAGADARSADATMEEDRCMVVVTVVVVRGACGYWSVMVISPGEGVSQKFKGSYDGWMIRSFDSYGLTIVEWLLKWLV
jgi:hypothetical protein